MAKNFFELVNPNFFLPLASKYRVIYFDILVLINEKMGQDGLQLEKGEIIDAIEDYFKSRPNLTIGDERLDNLSFAKRASSFLRDLTNYGWFYSEVTGDFKELYTMDPVAVDILDAMQEVIRTDASPLESTGYVSQIFKDLTNFNPKEAAQTAEQIELASKRLSNNLRSVSSKMKKYLDRLLKQDNQNPEKILYELLSNYENNVVSRSFNNLRTRDNPSKYKEIIFQSIDKLEYEEMDELINNYIEVKCGNKRTEETILEARVFYERIFNNLRRQFQNINDKIDALDVQNAKYIASATSRVTFLLNEKDNLEGKIDSILRLYESKKVSEDEIFEFTSNQLNHIDDTSLYMHTKSSKPEASLIEVEPVEMNPEELERYRAVLERQARFTIKGVDNFIMNQMQDKEVILASEIPLETFDDFMMLFLACIYSKSDDVSYDVEQVDNYVIYTNRKLRDFKITRRVK